MDIKQLLINFNLDVYVVDFVNKNIYYENYENM